MKEIKISKLFHLLYATLLLAPVFAVGVSCAQTAFTGNGITEIKPEFATEVIPENGVPKLGVWYYCDNNHTGLQFDLSGMAGIGLQAETGDDLSYDFGYGYTYTFPFTDLSIDGTIQGSYDFNSVWTIPQSRVWAICFTSMLSNFSSNRDLGSYLLPFPQDKMAGIPSTFEEGYQDVFYTSVDTVAQSPFFNWAEKSFLGDGFRYMGNIFGMPTDNPFYTFACYWCAISILWLIFDVVMYVPKLAHRWLDKGAIE